MSSEREESIKNWDDDAFEVAVFAARRKSSGSEFKLSMISPKYSPYDCQYINHHYHVDIKFHAKWVYEQRAVESRGRIVNANQIVGVILIEGELENLIREQVASTRADKISELLCDCYELIVAFGRERSDRHLGLTGFPKIYETSAQRLAPYVKLESVQVGPEAVPGSQAKRVF